MYKFYSAETLPMESEESRSFAAMVSDAERSLFLTIALLCSYNAESNQTYIAGV